MYTPSQVGRTHSFAFMENTKLLVSGAGGNSGRLIVQALAAQGQPVSALVRDKANAAALGELPGISLYAGDMLHKDSLSAALDGVERALLISSANDRMVDTQCTFIDACKTAGVRHVIKFSGEESQQGYDPEKFRFTREHEQIEDYLENSGLAWTHLRPSQFMQVYLREVPLIRQTGALRLPLEQIEMSPVDLRDVAHIAAALMITGGQEGKALRITGPEALSMADIAARIGRIIGHTVPYVPISWPERAAALTTSGLPAYFIEALAGQAAERCRHPEAIVDTSTHQLFKITPTTFSHFASDHAAGFAES